METSGSHRRDSGTSPYVDPGERSVPMRKLMLRLDEDLVEALRRWAAAEHRSMNAQIRVTLRQAIPDEHFEG